MCLIRYLFSVCTSNSCMDRDKIWVWESICYFSKVWKLNFFVFLVYLKLLYSWVCLSCFSKSGWAVGSCFKFSQEHIFNGSFYSKPLNRHTLYLHQTQSWHKHPSAGPGVFPSLVFHFSPSLHHCWFAIIFHFFSLSISLATVLHVFSPPSVPTQNTTNLRPETHLRFKEVSS